MCLEVRSKLLLQHETEQQVTQLLNAANEGGEVGVSGGVVKVAVACDRPTSPSPSECSQRRRRGELGVSGGEVKVAVGMGA